MWRHLLRSTDCDGGEACRRSGVRSNSALLLKSSTVSSIEAGRRLQGDSYRRAGLESLHTGLGYCGCDQAVPGAGADMELLLDRLDPGLQLPAISGGEAQRPVLREGKGLGA